MTDRWQPGDGSATDRAWLADWRTVRERLFREHPQSPVPRAERTRFQAHHFEHDPALRFSVTIERYLVDPAKSADLGGDPATGTLILDFNFAYQQSCAFDPRWACPLAPPENRLAIAVRAGERLA